MYCPLCGKQQVSDQIRFCSGCGFPLTGVSEVVAAGGASPRLLKQQNNASDSPRKRGIKQGAWIMLVGCLLLVPMLAIAFAAFRFSPLIIPIAAILSFMGGLLRIVYATMFESSTPRTGLEAGDYPSAGVLPDSSVRGSLPPQTSIPISDLKMPEPGHWRDSADLTPASVTESTTRLLEKKEPQ